MIQCSIYKELHTSHGNINLDVSFQIEQGTLLTVFGPSGAGKTTILRTLAGLAIPDRGVINFAGETWFDSKKKINLPPQKRRTGFVFQDYALFPNMSVKENLGYALDKGEKKENIEEVLYVMDLEQLQKRKPNTLSGGQKQRVALARALVRKPKLLLLDEPLSALDVEMRLKLQDHILKVHKQFHLTTILVSHDFTEIYKMSDNIIMLQEGKITKQGITSEILANEKINDFELTGEVIRVEKNNSLSVISVKIGDEVVQDIISTDQQDFKAGDKVLISIQAMNTVVKKLS